MPPPGSAYIAAPPAPAPAFNAAPAYNPPPAAFNPGPASSAVVLSSYDNSAVDAMLQRLSQPDENVRRDAIMELAKMKADRAVDSLVSVLANDSSPTVRDAAARGLGLIGSTRALNALIRATLADSDREVRHRARMPSSTSVRKCGIETDAACGVGAGRTLRKTERITSRFYAFHVFSVPLCLCG